MGTKLNYSNCNKTQKVKLWQNFKKNHVVIKLNLWQKLNCDNTQIVTKLKLWQKSKTQILTKLKNSNCYKTQILKLWQNITYEKSQFMTKETLKWSVSQNILTPWQTMSCSLAMFCLTHVILKTVGVSTGLSL